MTQNAHLEVVLGVLARHDVAAEHLACAATFDNSQILGRVVSNPKSPEPLIREIMDRSTGREGEVWVHLHEYTERALDRI